MALTKITKTGIGADAIDGNKLGDNSISEEHLDTTVITGHTELSETANDSDVFLIYDESAGALKKVLRSNIVLQAPGFTSISPTNILTGDGTGNATFTITGTNFSVGTTAQLVTSGGAVVPFDTITRDSATQLTCVIAISSLSNANEPYGVQVLGGNGLNTAVQASQVNIDASPIFNTASGTLGTIDNGDRDSTTLTIEAYDPESAGNVTFEIQSGSLPAGATTTTVNENGVSKFQISGFSQVGSNTTSNFTVRAADANSNVSSRAYSITVNAALTESFTSSGTFSVPSGITSVTVLVVAGGGGGGHPYGGGGGAGGLVFMPGYPVTPGGTVSVTVGCGGASNISGTDACASSSQGFPGQDSVFGTLTAKGGAGGGGRTFNGNPGGSGGGAGRDAGQSGGCGGTATQPTQPGNSGAYGFGNAGGNAPGPTWTAAGGGGGAGAAGGNGPSSAGNGPCTGGDLAFAGPGGDGRAYTIADGTTPVYYAGGGGGSRLAYPGPLGNSGGGQGGQGGGGRGAVGCVPAQNVAGQSPQPGEANKGGGGGGGILVPTFAPGSRGYSGGKGIVIVQY